jgi:MFS family permease
VSTPEPSATTRAHLGLYFGILLLTLGLAEPNGLISLPVLFWLKDGLQLSPHSLAVFDAITLVPTYFTFAFGFLRDRWKPLGRSDRGYFLLLVPIASASYCWLAAGAHTWTRLLLGILVATAAFEALAATTEALMTAAAQHHVMTGRLSAVSEVAEMVPSIASFLIGGWMASHVALPATFLVAAALTSLVLVQTLWRPSLVVSHSTLAASNEKHTQAIRQLLRDRTLLPAVGVLLLWNFSPGFGTPLLYFLSDHVRVSPEVYGTYQAVADASSAVAAFVYAVTCRRFPLGRILKWTLAANLLVGFLLLLAGNGVQAVTIGAIIGLVLGMGNIGLFDLLRRSCPPRLEGTGMMLGYSVFAASGTVSDLLGAWLYEHGGFVPCLVGDAIATAGIFPLLMRVPHAVLAAREGERATDR